MDGKILIMDYSKSDLEKNKYILSAIGNFDILEITNLNQFYKMQDSLSFISLIIIDINFPTEKEGFSIISSLRNLPETKYVPLIIITKSNSYQFKNLALKYSVNDYIEKPFKPYRLEASIKSIIKIEEETKYVVNESAKIIMSFDEYIAKELYMVKRTKQRLSILLITMIKPQEEKLISIDSSSTEALKKKSYNIAIHTVKQSLRLTDYAILNNWDIIVVLPNTDSNGAKVVKNKIMSNIDLNLVDINLKFDDLFFSTIVTYPEEGDDFQDLMSAALKKVNDKEMLEKFTTILDETKSNATRKYTQFKKYTP